MSMVDCPHGISGGMLCPDCFHESRRAPSLVDHPLHYNQGPIEAIDAIESALGRDGQVAYLRGSILKYAWRLGHKDDAVQDAMKLRWYADRLVKVLAS